MTPYTSSTTPKSPPTIRRPGQWLRSFLRFCRLDWGDYPFTPGRAVYLFREKFGHGLRTAYYRDFVRPLIIAAAPFPTTDDPDCEIHVLPSEGDWVNLLWALRTFYDA